MKCTLAGDDSSGAAGFISPTAHCPDRADSGLPFQLSLTFSVCRVIDRSVDDRHRGAPVCIVCESFCRDLRANSFGHIAAPGRVRQVWRGGTITT